MKNIREWFKDITPKLNSPVKFHHLLKFKLVFFLIIIIAIAVVVVFAQYPQVLRSFAKPPQAPCGFSDTRCCGGNVCNAGLACYSPDNSTPKRCKSNSAVCGNSVDKPCCYPDGTNMDPDGYCNASLRCDKSKSPPYPYQNPWNNGLCAVSYNVCGGQNEACCGDVSDKPKDRCDNGFTCVWTDRSQTNSVCNTVTLTSDTPDGAKIFTGPLTINLSTNMMDYPNFSADCGNGYQPPVLDNSFNCGYSDPGRYIVTANVRGSYDPYPVQYITIHIQVLSRLSPTPRPTRRPTSSPTRTPAPTGTPRPNPTSAYTCNGTCLPNGEDCYQTGGGSCPSGRFCCQTIDRPPAATPTTRPPNTPVPPTKVPTGGYCSYNSQCGSNFCCNNYCQPSNYYCPS